MKDCDFFFFWGWGGGSKHTYVYVLTSNIYFQGVKTHTIGSTPLTVSTVNVQCTLHCLNVCGSL